MKELHSAAQQGKLLPEAERKELQMCGPQRELVRVLSVQGRPEGMALGLIAQHVRDFSSLCDHLPSPCPVARQQRGLD